MIIKGYTLMLIGMQFRYLAESEDRKEMFNWAVMFAFQLPVFGRVFGFW